jgi:hypothetical protein
MTFDRLIGPVSTIENRVDIVKSGIESVGPTKRCPTEAYIWNTFEGPPKSIVVSRSQPNIMKILYYYDLRFTGCDA